jgi:predicted permease
VVELNLGLDWRVLGFSLVLSLVTGVLFSLAPALSATRPDLIPALKDDAVAGSPTHTRLRSLMVGAQMAVTVILLVVAGLFLRALRTIDALKPGWNADNVYLMTLDVELNGTSRDEGQIFYRELAARVRALAGVEASGLAAKLPLGGRSSFGQINVAGVPTPEGRSGHDAFLNRVSPGYFHTLGVALLQGRDISNSDREGRSTVAVINRAMAERFWPNDNAVGKQFYTGAVGEGRAFEVVGVVENTKYNRLVEETPNFYYVAAQQFYNSKMTLHFRATSGSEQTVAATLQRVVRELDPSLPIQPITSLDDQLGIFFLPQRLAAWVAGIMGIFGLILGAVGVYGVTAFSIGQRTREIAVRIALGARGADVLRMMIGQGLRAPMAGVAVGLLVTFAITRFLSSLLAGVSPIDSVTFVGVVVGLSGVAALATFLPARRASKIDPMTTLRTE